MVVSINSFHKKTLEERKNRIGIKWLKYILPIFYMYYILFSIPYKNTFRFRSSMKIEMKIFRTIHVSPTLFLCHFDFWFSNFFNENYSIGIPSTMIHFFGQEITVYIDFLCSQIDVDILHCVLFWIVVAIFHIENSSSSLMIFLFLFL